MVDGKDKTIRKSIALKRQNIRFFVIQDKNQDSNNCNDPKATSNTARAPPWQNCDFVEDYELVLKMDPALRKSIFPGIPPFINYVPIGGFTGQVVR